MAETEVVEPVEQAEEAVDANVMAEVERLFARDRAEPEAPETETPAAETESTETPAAATAPKGGDEDGTPAAPSPSSFKVLDRELSEDEAKAALGAFDYVRGLTPDQVALIDGIAAGAYVPLRRDDPRLAPAPATPAPAADEEEWLDPRAGEAIAELRQTIAELRQSQVGVASEVQGQQFAHIRSIVDQTRAEWATEHELAPEIAVKVEGVALQQGLPAKLAKQPRFLFPDGSPNVAAISRAAYDEVLTSDARWAIPEIREAELGKLISEKVETTLAERNKIADRRAAAAEVTGSSGSIPRTPPDPRQLSTQEREKAAVTELDQLWNR